MKVWQEILMTYVFIFLRIVTINPQGRPLKHYDPKHQPPALSVKSADHDSKLDLPFQGILQHLVGSMSGEVVSPIRRIQVFVKLTTVSPKLD